MPFYSYINVRSKTACPFHLPGHPEAFQIHARGRFAKCVSVLAQDLRSGCPLAVATATRVFLLCAVSAALAVDPNRIRPQATTQAAALPGLTQLSKLWLAGSPGSHLVPLVPPLHDVSTSMVVSSF